MAKDELVETGKARKPRVLNEYHSPTSKVTIAFPFSQIKMQSPSEELRELALIMIEVSEAIAKLHPSPDTELLVERARTVVTRLDEH